MKIIADNKIPYLKGVLEPFIEVVYSPGGEITKEKLNDVVGLITRTRTKCNEDLLAGTAIKAIASATIGIDHIDTHYCETNNIKWFNAPGCNSGGVQQWFITALLHYVIDKQKKLSDLTLGVIGVGNVGKKIVRFAEAVGMRVLLNDPPREEREGSCQFRSLDVLQQECDILTFHVPLITKGKYKTYHMADDDFFKKVKPETLLINSCRGEVVDTESLQNAMLSGIISDVIIDVWEDEPNLSRSLLEKCFLATPHIAGYSIEGKANGTAAVVRAIAKTFDFPLEEWYPDEVANQPSNVYLLNMEQKSFEELLLEVYATTYNIRADYKLLLDNPERFEDLRSNYNYRNEPIAWTIELFNKNLKFTALLKALGFKVKE